MLACLLTYSWHGHGQAQATEKKDMMTQQVDKSQISFRSETGKESALKWVNNF